MRYHICILLLLLHYICKSIKTPLHLQGFVEPIQGLIKNKQFLGLFFNLRKQCTIISFSENYALWWWAWEVSIRSVRFTQFRYIIHCNKKMKKICKFVSKFSAQINETFCQFLMRAKIYKIIHCVLKFEEEGICVCMGIYTLRPLVSESWGSQQHCTIYM